MVVWGLFARGWLHAGQESDAYKTSVEGAGEASIRGSLHQGTAIREDGEGVFAAAEAHQHAVHPDVSEGAKAGGKRGQIDRAMVFVDLHGISAAECDVRARIA